MSYNLGKHIYKIAVGFDQWACSIANGNIDSTISATVGYYYKHSNSWFWRSMKDVIDLTFFPVDGINHCIQSYEKDPNEDFEQGIKPLMALFTIVGCIPIGLITWSIQFVKYLFKTL